MVCSASVFSFMSQALSKFQSTSAAALLHVSFRLLGAGMVRHRQVMPMAAHGGGSREI
jgi:hypothetical protein